MVGMELMVAEQHELITAITNLEKAKEEIEAKEAEMRVQLQAVMAQYDVWDIDVPGLKVTRIPSGFRHSIDTKKLRAEYSQIAKECEKTTPVKESIRISTGRKKSDTH